VLFPLTGLVCFVAARLFLFHKQMVRGNSIIVIEALERASK